MSGFLQRFITALLFAAVMLTGIWWGNFLFLALFTLIAGLASLELLNLLLPVGQPGYFWRKPLGIVLGLAPHLYQSLCLLAGLAPNWTAAFLAAMLILSGLFILELFAAAPRPFDNVARLALVIAYIGLPIALLDWIAFRGGSYDLTLPLGLLLLTWISDTAAYLVGSRFGRGLLFPRISPKKTWEGTVGGGLLTIGLSLLFAELLGELSSGQWAVLALLVVIFGSLGDLVESMLKRSRGVKDSGTLLPGHGGVLDRFDAFIFLLPWAAAYLWWIG